MMLYKLLPVTLSPLEILNQAIRQRDVATAERIVTKVKDINQLDSNGFAPIHYAMDYFYPDMVRILLGNNALANTRTSEGYLPIHLYRWSKRNTDKNMIIRFTRNPDLFNLPIHDAARAGDLEKLIQLISASEDVDAVDAGYQTPLYIAVSNNHPKIVETLLQANADPNISTEYGQVSLHSACWAMDADIDRREILKLLVEAGADVFRPTGITANAFYRVDGSVAIEAIILLLSYGFRYEELFNADQDTFFPTVYRHAHFEAAKASISPADREHALKGILGSELMHTHKKMISGIFRILVHHWAARDTDKLLGIPEDRRRMMMQLSTAEKASLARRFHNVQTSRYELLFRRFTAVLTAKMPYEFATTERDDYQRFSWSLEAVTSFISYFSSKTSAREKSQVMQ